MPRTPEDTDKLIRALRWLPILAYFVIKYIVLDNEMSLNQQLTLVAAVVLAEIALWLYGRKRKAEHLTKDDATHGAN